MTICHRINEWHSIKWGSQPLFIQSWESFPFTQRILRFHTISLKTNEHTRLNIYFIQEFIWILWLMFFNMIQPYHGSESKVEISINCEFPLYLYVHLSRSLSHYRHWTTELLHKFVRPWWSPIMIILQGNGISRGRARYTLSWGCLD